MSTPKLPADDANESVEHGASPALTDPDEYGGLSIEDDPEGTVDPGELAGGADETDEDVS